MTAGEGDCPLESAKQSEHSPDVVGNSERLGRLIYNDEQVDDTTGQLKAGAFKIEEFIDQERRGASVSRVDHLSPEELRHLVQRFEAAHGQRRVRGLGFARTLNIRQIYDKAEKRAFCVIDDGKPDYTTHTLVTRSQAYRDPGLSKQQLRTKLKPLRERLRQLFSPITKIDDIHGGGPSSPKKGRVARLVEIG